MSQIIDIGVIIGLNILLKNYRQMDINLPNIHIIPICIPIEKV